MTILRFAMLGLILAALGVCGLAVAQQFETPATTPPPPTLLPPTAIPGAGNAPTTTPADVAPSAAAPVTAPPRIPGAPSGQPVVVEATPDGRFLRAVSGLPAVAGNSAGFVLSGTTHHDPESAKLLSQEHAAAQEARELTQKFQTETSDAQRESLKTALKDKLKQVFDLQQARRTKEIERIEDRLTKLKDTMKKREGNKDAIVGRKLDELTGGVDVLGWEETGGPYGSAFNPLGGGGYPAPRTDTVPSVPRSK